MCADASAPVDVGGDGIAVEDTASALGDPRQIRRLRRQRIGHRAGSPGIGTVALRAVGAEPLLAQHRSSGQLRRHFCCPALLSTAAARKLRAADCERHDQH
jgi:hypothetical protein